MGVPRRILRMMEGWRWTSRPLIGCVVDGSLVKLLPVLVRLLVGVNDFLPHASEKLRPSHFKNPTPFYLLAPPVFLFATPSNHEQLLLSFIELLDQ